MRTEGKVAIGLGGALAIVLLASRSAEAKPVSRRTAPSKLVPFTQEKIFWRYNKKKKKDEYRVQIAEPLPELAARASRKLGRRVSPSSFILAAMIASEAGSNPDTAKTAVAHAAITMAKKLGVSLTSLLAPNKQGGRLGSQHGRYASTARPPSAAELEIAEAVEKGQLTNPTPGAVQWDSPAAQDKLTAEGAPGYEIDADALAARRAGENKIAVYVPGVDPRELRLWRPA